MPRARQYEWDKAHAGAVAAQDVDGDGGNMNWTVYLESLGGTARGRLDRRGRR